MKKDNFIDTYVDFSKEFIDTCEANVAEARNNLDGIIKSISSIGAGLMIDFVKRYRGKKHILIQGEKGVGKTFAIDKYLKDEKIHTEFIAGNESIETIDLIGYYTKDPAGNNVWLDGVLSRCFRLAKDKMVVLFYDELLRTKARELGILVGSLTPSSDGTYRLRTNRIVNVDDGVGETELLEIPQENIWVIGTTNVGSKYNVEEMDSALNDRFRIFTKTTSEAELKSIIKYWLSTVSHHENYADKFYLMYEKINALFEKGELSHQMNIRHISETIQFSKTPKDFITYLMDLVPNLCLTDMNGNINSVERDILVRVIKSSLK